MAKNRVRTGFAGKKEDNVCDARFRGEWQREAAVFWRDSLQKGQIKVTLQRFLLNIVEIIARRKHFQLL